MSEETSGKRTIGQKVRLGAFVLVVAIALWLVAGNWHAVPLMWFPFAKPVELPLTLVCLFSFGIGAGVTFVWVSARALRKKREEPPTLPPAATGLKS